MMFTSLPDQQPDHKAEIQSFTKWVKQNCKPGITDPKDDEGHLFLPYHRLKDYFEASDHHRLRELLRASFAGKQPVEAAQVARHCLKVFCILLLIGKGQFINSFLEYPALQDACLPFNVDSPPRPFPTCPSDEKEEDFLRRFCDKQWMVCPPEMEYRTGTIFEDNRILPIISKEPLSRGASATLYKIKLDPSYNRLHSHTDQVTVSLYLISM